MLKHLKRFIFIYDNSNVTRVFFDSTTLTFLLKWWNIGLWINSLGILCLSEGRSSHNSFPLISGNVARLKEEHEVTCKQANPHSVSFWTSFEPILVMFRYENCSCLKFAYDTPGSEKSCRTPFNRRNYIHVSFIKAMAKYSRMISCLNLKIYFKGVRFLKHF